MEFGEEFHSRLVRMLLQPLNHLWPVSRAALATGTTTARLVAEAAVFGSPDHDAASSRILTPLLHALGQTSHVLRMKTSWELDAEFVEQLRTMCVTPHIAAKAKASAIVGHTTRHAGYAVSQRKRKLVEEPFGWGKTVGPIRKTMLRGLKRVCAQFTLTMAAYNLAWLPRLLAA